MTKPRTYTWSSERPCVPGWRVVRVIEDLAPLYGVIQVELMEPLPHWADGATGIMSREELERDYEEVTE